jgi:hypothetical protein
VKFSAPQIFSSASLLMRTRWPTFAKLWTRSPCGLQVRASWHQCGSPAAAIPKPALNVWSVRWCAPHEQLQDSRQPQSASIKIAYLIIIQWQKLPAFWLSDRVLAKKSQNRLPEQFACERICFISVPDKDLLQMLSL